MTRPARDTAHPYWPFGFLKPGRHSAKTRRSRRSLLVFGILVAFAVVGVMAAAVFMTGGKNLSLGRVAVVASVRHLDPADTPLTPTLSVTGQDRADYGTDFSVNYSVTVSGPDGDPIPSGSVVVTYVDIDSGTGNCTAVLDDTGNGSCQLTENPGDGPFAVTASYGGDDNYGEASGTVPTVAVSDNSGGVETGGSFTYTVIVSNPAGGPTPTGTLGWSVTGPGGTTPVCSDTTLSGGQATCAITSALAGTYDLNLTYSGDSNYTASTGSDTSASVDQFPLTITASSTTSTYGTTPTVSPSYSAFPPGQDAGWLTTPPTCTSTVSATSAVGTYSGANACYGAVDPYYAITYIAGDAAVNAAPLTITASSTSTTYGTVPTVTPSYSGFVNGEGAGSLTTSPTCSSTVTATSDVGPYPGANTCSGAVDSNYDITYVAGDATVTKAGLTITASSTSTTYGTAPTVAPIYMPSDDAGSVTTAPTCVSAVTPTTTVGTHDGANTCSGAVDPDYDITYVAGDATVTKAGLTITASSTSSVYGTVPNVTPSYSGFVNSQDSGSLTTGPSCSSAVSATSDVGIHTGANTCSGAVDSNYDISYVAGDATVSPAPLTITASSTSTTYGTVPTVSPSYSAFPPGQNSSSLTAAPTCSTTVSSTTGVGTHTDANTCSGAVGPNYTISYESGDATVSQAPLTITASSTSTTYGTIPSVSPSYSAFPSGQTSSSLTSAPTCSSTVTATTGVGSHSGANTCSGAVDSNYDISYVAGDATVNKASLAIKATDGTMIYGGTPPAITVASYTGFVNGETASSLTTAPTCTSGATSSSPVGTYDSTCSGAADPDYTISYTNGSVTVSPAPLKITASDTTTTYGTVATVKATYSGFVNGDTSSSLTAQPTCSSTAMASSPVATYGSSCSGAIDPNYTITYAAGSVTVNPAPLTVTASSPSITYGAAPPTIKATYSGLVNGDTSSSLTTQPACSTTATASSGVGTYPSTCSGAADPNYTITYVAGTLTIGQATPTVTVTGESGQATGPVTITVNVSGPTGVDVPTGSVAVSDANAKCTIASLDATGSGSCALVENYSENGKTVTASYAGDTNYLTASGTTTEDVALGTPTVTVNAPSSATTGEITYDVTVAGNGAAPTGSVTISDGTNTCNGTLNDKGIAVCQLQESTGTYSITATYPGDGNYSPASSTASEVINETATSLQVSASSLVYGQEQSATFSVTVTPPPGETPPTGATVELMAGTQTLCVTSSLTESYVTVVDPVLGPVQVPVATADCHLAPAAIPAGTYSVAAEFPGVPGSFVGSTSTAAPLTVESAPTTTTLSVSGRTTTYGKETAETVTVDVAEPSAGSSFVTGTVTVKAGSTTLCTPTLKAGVATCKLTRAQLAVGSHVIVADYAGSSSLLPSSSSPTAVIVAKALTTSALSLSRTTASYGSEENVKFTAQVTVPAGMPAATGEVIVSSGSARLCVITLSRGKGSCSLTASELSVGSHSITARYVGSTDLALSASPSRTLKVTKAAR